MTFTGIIFDADGTLLDSLPLWMSVGSTFIRQNNLIPHPELDRMLYPMTMEQAAEYLLLHYSLSAYHSSEQVIAAVNALITDAYASTIPAKEGALSFVALCAAKHIPMSIATASDQQLVQAACNRLGFSEYIPLIASCSSLHTTKDDIAMYDYCAQQMHSLRQHTLVIEDSLQGIRTAKQYGYCVCGIYDKVNDSDTQTIKNISDYYFTNWNDLQEGIW